MWWTLGLWGRSIVCWCRHAIRVGLVGGILFGSLKQQWWWGIRDKWFCWNDAFCTRGVAKATNVEVKLIVGGTGFGYLSIESVQESSRHKERNTNLKRERVHYLWPFAPGFAFSSLDQGLMGICGCKARHVAPSGYACRSLGCMYRIKRMLMLRSACQRVHSVCRKRTYADYLDAQEGRSKLDEDQAMYYW